MNQNEEKAGRSEATIFLTLPSSRTADLDAASDIPLPSMSTTHETAYPIDEHEKSPAYRAAGHLAAEGMFSEHQELRQDLQMRHVQMIALAGTIGTGLFLSSGQAVAQSGPLGALLGYLVIGLTACSVTFANAEMGALVPLSGGSVRYAEHFVDPALAFANGWNLVYSCLVGLPAGLVAAAVLLLVITCGGGPNGDRIGFRYWRDPGPLVQYLGMEGSLGRFLGVWTALSQAVYAYSGIEGITMAAAETKSPRQAIPHAAKRILIRVFGTASTSPFVLAAKRAGITGVPSLINAVILTSAWSAGNSQMLSATRVLYGLAIDGRAPQIFTRLNRFAIPWVAVALYGLFMCLGYMSLSDGASVAFRWLQNLVAISTLVNWLTICTTYLRFYYGMKKQGIPRSALPWAAPFQPYMTWISGALFSLILITGGYATFLRGNWSTETFVSSYLNIPLFAILYLGYKFVKKTKMVALEDIPIRGFMAVAEAHPEEKLAPNAGLRRLNILW
ncbi:Amino acid/polyamine transporter I [Diplocarpon rosae]|nr:Amino acid/polyamine transporter I [Diplocarpon rosae]